MKEYFKNPWNYIHTLGSCVLAFSLYSFTRHILAYAVAFMCGILWECFDQANKEYGWEIWFFDPDGWDYRDLIMDAIGILWSYILIWGLYAN